MTQIESLQNAASNIDGLRVYKKQQEDKRKKIDRFFLSLNGATISPCLDFTHMNAFILGMIKAHKLK